MQKIAGRMRIFAEPGAPTVAMSATATAKEVEDMVNNLGLRKKPVVLRDASILKEIYCHYYQCLPI